MVLSDTPEIHLSDKSPLSKGMERRCYLHPNDPRLVVKVPLHSGVSECQANEDELRGYQLLKEDNITLDFISHCYGFISTDLGKGLLCDCIRDDNEEVSKTIWDVVIYQEECDIEYVLKVINKFCSFLIINRVWIYDLNLKNIVLQRKADGSYHPYIIDLKGRSANTEFIPISRYIPYFALRKLKRRTRQLIERITEYHLKRDQLRHN